MARQNRNHTPTIIANEILLEGPDSNTTARLSFQGNRLTFQDTRTGNDLLTLDSDSSEVNFSTPIRLPDGTTLNTVSDVSVRDFELRASIPVIVYGADGEPKNEEEPVTITAVLTGLSTENATFSTNPAIELGGTGNVRYLYPTSLLDIDKVDITATADEFSETITITKVSEGDDGITVTVTNPSDVISSDSDGNIVQADLLNANGVFSLYKGATNLTGLSRVAYRVDDVVNISININPTTGEYQVTDFDADADKGSATLVAIYSGIEYTHVYKIVKAKAGQPGANGLDGNPGTDGESPYIGLVSDENIFIDTINNNNVANINPSAVNASNELIATIGNFEIYKGTLLQTEGVKYYIGTTGTDTSIEKNNLSFSINEDTGAYSASVSTTIVQETNGWSSESETFTVRALIGGITVATRKIKIQKTKIGKDGKSGPSLKLNVSPSLFKFNGEGQPASDNQVLTIKVLSSNLPDAATTEIVSEPMLTLEPSNTDKTLSVQNFIDGDGDYLDSAVIKAQTYVDGELYIEDFVTIFRTQNGTDAKSIVLSSDSQVFTFKDNESIVSTTDAVFVNIKTQNLTQTVEPADITITKNNGETISLLSSDLVNNNDGSYTIELDYMFLNVTDVATRDAIFPVKIRVDKQGVFDIMSIHKLIGGSDALSGYLTNESDQIPAFADGTTQPEDYSTLNGYFKVNKGLEEVTENCTFEVTYNENIVTTINSNGFYSVEESSVSSTSDTARSVIQASLGDAVIQKVFTVTKTKQGKNTLNAILSNETHTVRAESNGDLVQISDLDSAGGIVTLYDGNEKVLNGATFSVLQGDENAVSSGTSYNSSGLVFSIDSATGIYTLSTDNLTSWTGNTEVFYVKIEYENTDITKAYTVTKSKGGADAKLMTLRANRMVFAFDSDNNPSPSGQEITFVANPTKGSVPIDVPITWSVTPSSYESLLVDLDPVDSKKKRILIQDFRTANLQDLLVTAEADGLEDSITVVKAKDGASGEDARSIKVTATSMVVGYDTEEDVIPDPEIITVFITQQNLSKVLDASDVVITKQDDTTVSPASIDSTGVNTATNTGDSFFTLAIGEDVSDLISKSDFPIQIEVLSTSDNVRDILSINKISGGKDGVDAVTAFLTNESHTVPAESDGFVSNAVLGDAGGTFEIYKGLTKISNTEGTTDNVTFSVVGGTVSDGLSTTALEGLVISVDQSTGVYSLSNQENTSWGRNYQTFTLRAHYEGQNYDKIYTLSKSKEGQRGTDGVDGADGLPGTDAKSVKLESDDYQIAYDEEGKNPQPATFTLTATQQNHDNNDAVYYFYEIDDLGNENLIEQGDSDTENTRVIESNADKFITKKYKVKTKESTNGSFVASDSISVVATKDGADSVTIVVPNDNHTFPADADGVITAEDIALGGTEIEIYIGNDRLEAVDSETDGIATVLDKKQFYVTKTDSSIATTLSKVDQDQSTQKYFKYFVSPIEDSMNADSATVAVQIVARGNSDSSQTYNRLLSYSKSKKGTDGDDGAPGSDGISPVNGVLTNESHTVVADAQGVVANLDGSEGVFRVYRGQTEITNTSAVSFSVVSTEPQNGLSISIETAGETKGSYSLSQNSWNSDSESFVLQAVVDGTTTIQKIFTITKSKAGVNGEPAKYLILEATKQSFDKAYQGEDPVFSPDGQEITFVANIYGEFESAPTVEWYVDGTLVTNNLYITDNGDGTATMSQDQFTSATSNLTNLSTTVKARITEGTELEFTDQITVILSQQGKDGSSGKDAKTVKLESDDYQIAYKQRGESPIWNKQPTSVTLTATPSDTVNPAATKKYRFYINSDTPVVREDETINTFVIDNFEDSYDEFVKRNVKVELIEDVGGVEEIVATDSIVIFATKDGSDAVTIAMPNNNHTFPSDHLGQVDASSYSTGVTEIEVYLGNRQLQPVASSTTDEALGVYEFKISDATAEFISAGNLSDISISGLVATTSAPSAMNINSKTASITYEIKVKDTSGVIRTFLQKQSFTKSERGEDGSDAKALFLLSDSEAFFVNKDGDIVNSTIEFSIIKENISSAATFSSVPPNLLTIDANNETATLAFSDFGTNDSVIISVEATDGTVYSDSVTITKVESGQDGSKGTDAKIVKLESDDYQIGYDENGENPTPSTIELTATQQNHAASVFYKFFIDGSAQSRADDTINTFTYSSIASTREGFGNPKTFLVKTYESQDDFDNDTNAVASDSISVIATKDGSNSINITIPNENHTFVANENGQVTDYSGADTEIQVYIGNTPLEAVSSIGGPDQFSVSVAQESHINISNVAPSTTDSEKYILSSIGSMSLTEDSAFITLAIVVRGKTASQQTFYRTLSYSKSKKGFDGTDGTDGQDGAPGADGEDGRDTENVFDFSAVYEDEQSVERAYGWADNSDPEPIFSTTQKYSFLGEITSTDDSEYGGNLLKLSTSAVANDNRIIFLNKPVTIGKGKDYNFKFKFIKESGNPYLAAYPVVFFFDRSRQFIQVSSQNITHQYSGFSTGGRANSKQIIEKEILYTGYAASNDSTSEGFPDNENSTSDIEAKFPKNTRYAIPAIVYYSTTDSSAGHDFFIDLLSFEEKKIGFTTFFGRDSTSENYRFKTDLVNVPPGFSNWTSLSNAATRGDTAESRFVNNKLPIDSVNPPGDYFDWNTINTDIAKGISADTLANNIEGRFTDGKLNTANAADELKNSQIQVVGGVLTGIGTSNIVVDNESAFDDTRFSSVVTEASTAKSLANTANSNAISAHETADEADARASEVRGFFDYSSTPQLNIANAADELKNSNIGLSVDSSTGALTLSRGSGLSSITQNPLSATEFTSTKTNATNALSTANSANTLAGSANTLANNIEGRFTGGKLNADAAADELKNSSIGIAVNSSTGELTVSRGTGLAPVVANPLSADQFTSTQTNATNALSTANTANNLATTVDGRFNGEKLRSENLSDDGDGFRFTDSNKIKIGIDNASIVNGGQTEEYDSDADIEVVTGSVGIPDITFLKAHKNTAGSTLGQLIFKGWNRLDSFSPTLAYTARASISGKSNSSGGGYLSFSVSPNTGFIGGNWNNVAVPQEKLYLSATNFNINNVAAYFDGGAVGINIAPSANYKLAINGSTYIEPANNSHTLYLERNSGKASIKSVDANLILDSGTSYASINHNVNENVILCKGGGKVAVGNLTSPGSALHVKQYSNSNSSGPGLRLEQSNSSTYWSIFTNNYLYFNKNGFGEARIAGDGVGNENITFTGQHRNKSDNLSLYTDSSIGLIVASVGEFSNLDGHNGITINESLPKVELTSQRNQKSAFGVISNAEDKSDGRLHSSGKLTSMYTILENDERLIVNSLGEGGIWVCNINGNLENGDYITSCEVAGFGMKQDSEFLANYTVAKITCDCDFDLNSSIYICEEFEWEGQVYRKAFVGCTYHCG